MGKKEELANIAELGFKFNYRQFEAKCPLRAKNLTFGYEPGRMLIEGLDIDIGIDDRICVIGKNGKGKSTLLRLLAGELKPLEGTVKKHPECAIGYFGQTNIDRLDANNTIEKELSLVRQDLKYGEIRKTCGAMMFGGDLALKKISVLSGGERSRVSLGKILLNPANLLLLDEPTNHLDIESCDSMIVALDSFKGAVVIVTHSEMFLHHLANRLIVFNNNMAYLFEGTYQDFLDRGGWEAVYEAKDGGKTAGFGGEKTGKAAREAAKRRRALDSMIERLKQKLADAEKKADGMDAEIAAAYSANNIEEARALQQEGGETKKRIDEYKEEIRELLREQAQK